MSKAERPTLSTVLNGAASFFSRGALVPLLAFLSHQQVTQTDAPVSPCCRCRAGRCAGGRMHMQDSLGRVGGLAHNVEGGHGSRAVGFARRWTDERGCDVSLVASCKRCAALNTLRQRGKYRCAEVGFQTLRPVPRTLGPRFQTSGDC